MSQIATSILQHAGVKNLEELDLSDPEIQKSIGMQMLELMFKKQRPNYGQEIADMGVPLQSTRFVETIEEYRGADTGFCLARAEQSGTCMTSGGGKIPIVANNIYCMTAKVYLDANFSGCRLSPASLLFGDVYDKYDGQNLDGKSLLVWRSGGIGDLLFIRPILVHLKRLYPTCSIKFATRFIYHPLVNAWDEVDEVLDIPFDAQVMADADYHMTFEGLIEYCKDAERMDVHDLFARYMGLDPEAIDWIAPMEMEESNFGLPDNYTVVQVAASSTIRTPRPSTIITAINACTRVGCPVVIADSPHNVRRVDDIIDLCESPDMIYNFAEIGEGILDTIALIDKAKLVIAPDSCQVHLAAMQGTPCIGLYGPFPASVRTKRYPECVSVETYDKGLPCGGRECFTHGHLTCPHAEQCWSSINHKEMVRTIKEALA